MWKALAILLMSVALPVLANGDLNVIGGVGSFSLSGSGVAGGTIGTGGAVSGAWSKNHGYAETGLIGSYSHNVSHGKSGHLTTPGSAAVSGYEAGGLSGAGGFVGGELDVQF